MEVNLPIKEFKLLQAYFQMNLNKECVMGSNSSVEVIASIYGKKVQKNMDDYRGSVIVICIGSAGGNRGLVIFWCAAKDKSSILKNICSDLSKMGLPKGFCVICTPTAYLTEESWQEAVPHIYAGIC